MAILKEIPWKFGLTINYWMISNITENKISNTTTITVSGYVSKEQRELDIFNYCSNIEIIVPDINFTIEELYEQIKLDEQFVDATDDL